MMLARLTRFPLRRCLHTQAAQTISHSRLNRVGLGFAAGVVTTYFAWRLTADQNRIALDSHADSVSSPSTRKPTQAKAPRASIQTSTESNMPGPEVPPAQETETAIEPPSDASSTIPEGESEPSSSPEGENHGSNGAAYDPVTGEINWDCPCLGGMAHGPCGEQFREAFSCFVYSEEEPKGINCVEKFKAMQDCFRAHPEVYADEIMDDDEEEATAENVHTDTTALDQPESPATTEDPDSSGKPAKAQKKAKREPAPSSAASPDPVQT